MNDTIEQNAMFEQTYGVGYRRCVEEGIEKGIEQGIEKGIEQGILNTKKELIINMNSKGISVDIISDCVNLSIDEVNSVIEDIK